MQCTVYKTLHGQEFRNQKSIQTLIAMAYRWSSSNQQAKRFEGFFTAKANLMNGGLLQQRMAVQEMGLELRDGPHYGEVFSLCCDIISFGVRAFD